MEVSLQKNLVISLFDAEIDIFKQLFLKLNNESKRSGFKVSFNNNEKSFIKGINEYIEEYEKNNSLSTSQQQGLLQGIPSNT